MMQERCSFVGYMGAAPRIFGVSDSLSEATPGPRHKDVEPSEMNGSNG